MRESRFQREFLRELRELFPGCIILKNDPNYLQGFPDLLILFGDRWAALEIKADRDSPRQPNQEYYVELCDELSFSAFVHPKNKEDVLRDLQFALEPRRATRIPQR